MALHRPSATQTGPLGLLLCSLGGLVLCVGMTGPAEAAEKKKPVKKRHTVAVIGDSLSDYRSHGGGFIRYLEKRCPKSRFDNYGKGGWMVNQMRRRFKKFVFGAPGGKSKPKYTDVIIFGGVNDLYSDKTAFRTPAKIEKDLSKMYRWSRDANIRVVAINVSPWGGFRKYFNRHRMKTTHQLNRWILAQPHAGTVAVAIDAHGLLGGKNPEKLKPEYTKPFKDGLHFNKKAHKKLGKAVYKQAFSDCKLTFERLWAAEGGCSGCKLA